MKTVFKGLCATLIAAAAVQAADKPTPVTAPQEAHYTPEQVQADIDGWMHWLHRTHPQLTYTIKDIDAFYAQVQGLKESIDAPLTKAELWQKLTPINETFSDAHLMVGYKSNEEYLKQQLSQGAKLFPLDVAITDQDTVIIKSLAGGAPTGLRGSEIVAINGTPVGKFLPELLKRQHGDTPSHRRTIAAKRWSFLYLATFGSTDSFDISFEQDGATRTISLPGHGDIQKTAYATETLENTYACEMRGEATAYLRVDSYYWEDVDGYLAFMDNCFTSFKEAGAEKLIVDIRENGGGDDMFWMAGQMQYIAQVPYRHGSSFKVRILEKYRDPGEVVGDVVSGEISRMRPPETDLKNAFDGDFYLMVGPYTYSSSILFANAVKDHGIGKIVGVPTEGKRGQTGGTQRYMFPNTGLKAVSPRFILQPPKGGDSQAPVPVDIPLDTAGLDGDKALDAFIQTIEADR
ncbi:S41 family peptidase [Kordiimonas lacus]|uniref:C-terminal processing protease CtpA/Prc, contains a PDZ domain n=1 Tax=Kordiimonas lacus TaxID=637679 RepID=A0A1G6UL92_9PROT|nr:S41 family peptidase [Kordiimonas lacus]SDD42112.1 C-terminal processing protease CtpA/Prc, contains a PDZ domain [Kordiimonas lacus]